MTRMPTLSVRTPIRRLLRQRPRLRWPRRGIWAFLAALGPGLITTNAGNDAGGIATGKGLAGLIRERFGVRWTALAITSFFVASVATTASEFAGIAASSELF